MNIRCEIIKFLEVNTGNKFLAWHWSWQWFFFFFLDLTAEASVNKAKLNKQDYIKLKSFCTTKETINKTKRQYTKNKHPPKKTTKSTMWYLKAWIL